MKCLGCHRPGPWFCESCESDLDSLYKQVKDVSRFLGESQNEGGLVLSASKILEAYERVENSTSLGKSAIMARARELLAEVEDFYTNTPMCPLCKLHKLELITGDPMSVSCTGGCEFNAVSDD